mgnify:CR=1 FL=1
MAWGARNLISTQVTNVHRIGETIGDAWPPVAVDRRTRCIDESVGHLGHGGRHHTDLSLGCDTGNNGGIFAHALGATDGCAAKFVDLNS